MQPDSPIVEFYLGGKDNKGRTIDEVLQWGDAEVEASHDFIQWVFPLHERSLHSVGTPVLTKDDIEFFANSDIAKVNMKRCLARYKDFLGIDGDNSKFKRWARTGDHNLLRITRVIRSLRLFALDNEAVDFHTKVYAVAKAFMISSTTLEFWDKALNDSLDDSMTDKFLKMKEIRL